MSERWFNEHEPVPKVLVEFYGYNHLAINLQAIPGIITALKSHLIATNERTLLFIEAADYSRTAAEKFRKIVRERGFRYFTTAVILAEEMDLEPPPAQIIRRLEQIAVSDLLAAVEHKLIPLRRLQDYFLAQELDSLREEFNFDAEAEAHLPNVREKLLSISQERELADQVFGNWNVGNFDQSVEAVKPFLQSVAQSAEVRNHDIVDGLKGKVKFLVKSRQGGLFILFGKYHYPINDMLQRKLSPKVPVRFVNNGLLDENSPQNRIFTYLNLKQSLPAELCARYVVTEVAMEQIRQHTVSLGQLAYYYESLLVYLRRITMSLSFDEIRKLCEAKTDLLEWLRNHPQAGPLKPFLPATST